MNRCLLDLGANVNRLPYSVYKQLGLGELQLTSLTLLLADGSVKDPKEIVEDVILKVDKFYFPTNFIVLDTEPVTNPGSHSSVIFGRPFLTTAEPMINSSSHSPVILRRPFLTTVDAVIRCRNKVMILLFGNMTVELYIFHTSSQPHVIDDHEEVNMIDISVSHTFEESCYEDSFEKCLAHFGQNFDIDESIEEVNALLGFVPVIYTTPWKPKVEHLHVSTSIPVPSIIEPPKLELKPLPYTLKYAFLGEFKTLPVIFYFHLDKDQEGKMLDMLCKHKEALGWTIADIKRISLSVVMH